MNQDLSALFQSWPFEPDKENVRIITGDDGEPRIQIRLELGILQMHVEGRPDGLRPEGFDSALSFQEARADAAEHEGERFSLSPDDCEQLRSEAAQYYHRYMALLALEDYDGVVRDTSRNLRVLEICAAHAETEQDRAILEQFRPYITMVRARALASQAMKDKEPKAALVAIDEALEALSKYFTDRGETELFEQSGEVELLKSMRQSLVPKLPVSPKTELRARLADAIRHENYELAAILRDELKHMKE